MRPFLPTMLALALATGLPGCAAPPPARPPDAPPTAPGTRPAAPVPSSPVSAAWEASVPASFPSPLIVSIHVPDRWLPAELPWLGPSFTEMLAAELAEHPHLILIPPARLDAALRLTAAPPADRVPAGLRHAVGDLGATVLVTARASVARGRLAFEAHLFEIAHGSRLGRVRADGSVDHAAAVAAELADKVLRLLPPVE